MDVFIIIVLVVFGVLFGIIGSIAGIGGGAFYMSLMILLFAIPIDEARNTSTFIIALFSGVAFINYYRQGKIEIKLSLIFASFALLGSISATIFFFLIPIDNTILKIIIATIVLISGLNMIQKAIMYMKKEKLNSKNGVNNNNQVITFSFNDFDHHSNLKKGIPLFFMAGFIAYLSGIGGGMLFVPILTILFGIPIHFSTATSTSMIFFIGIYNTIVRMTTSEIHYLIGILIGIGAIFGSFFGSTISKKIHKHNLQFIVAIILIGLAIRMYFIV